MKNYKKLLWPLALIPIWYIVYTNLQTLSDWFVDTVLGLEKGAHFTESLRFFVFEVPKVMMLLTLIIFFRRHYPFVLFGRTHPQNAGRKIDLYR